MAKKSEMDKLLEMLGVPSGDSMWMRVRGKREDVIYGYVKREPSWLVFNDENGDGLLTYADPCESFRGKTAGFIYEYINDDGMEGAF